ncbi:MAG: HAMP domain-containing histidine kinase [Deltaproteobacteria bacterium]|nr:HAMP domain-containing histidine kinase [Deltaproteobacteria bacterium]MBW1819736.1 HAMP domain-containing histidine kinase [Deltaproteobacteria bacterium]
MNPQGTSAKNVVAGREATAERYDRVKAAEQASQALLSRPRVSLKLQVYSSSLLAFLVALGIATALVTTIRHVERKIRLLNIASSYVLEIEQARRFEKNFFLYGTNLSDAMEMVYKANDILNRNATALKEMLDEEVGQIIRPNLSEYRRLLDELVALQQETDSPDYLPRKKRVEVALREQGHNMVSLAQDLMSKEETALSETMERSREILIYALILIVLSLIFNAYLFGKRMLNNIDRFAVYAQRIASGDYTPITPIRRFRDEFTDLAITINQMIHELGAREAVLIQSHKMRAIGTLTAGVAHELNNPLNNITLTAHMLMEDYGGLNDEERKEMIGDVIQEAGRSKRIISNLLDFARESSAKLEPLDLGQLLQDTITLASNQTKLADMKVEFNAAGDLPRIHGDDQQLRQVFLNLILNAIGASPKKSRIQVLVLPADDPHYIAVKVIDFGKGIPEHIIGSIFDPFFTTKDKGRGTGLGLSVSQGIVSKHGGRISVTSKEGAGSTFTVTLPVTTFPAGITS